MKLTKGKIYDLDTPEGALAHKQWELSKYTTQELKSELMRREAVEYSKSDLRATVFVGDTCQHNMEMGYCEVEDCEGGY